MANYFKWFGHSMVEVQIDDTTVLFDPFLKNSETKLERVVKSTFKVSDFNSVNYVFVSHEHFDHLDKESLVGIAKRNNATVYTTEACARELKALLPANLLRVVSVGQSLKVANLNVQVVQASHASESPVGFVVSGGVGGGAASVYFAGDTHFFNEMRHIKADIAFLPIGGTFTMNVLDAVHAAKELKPQYAVPIHYNTFSQIRADALEFEKKIKESALGIDCIVPAVGERIEF